MNDKIELSPEGALIAKAVARGAGLTGNAIAPNTRMRDGVTPVSLAHPVAVHKPALAIDVDGLLRPTQLDELVGVRLGVTEDRDDAGLVRVYSIVMRRDGERLCQLDYDDEETCEAERDALRMEIDAWLTTGVPFEMKTQALKIWNASENKS